MDGSGIAPTHTFTEPSKLAVQRNKGVSGLLDPGPVGVHLSVNISLECPMRSNSRPFSRVHTFAVLSSEQLARYLHIAH